MSNRTKKERMTNQHGGTAIVLLGSNIEPESNLVQATQRLSQELEIRNCSSVYESEPVGLEDQPSFLNATLLIEVDRSPKALRTCFKQIESDMGRDRSRPSHGPRCIDIDLVLYQDEILRENEFRLPDPDLLEHSHVAVPAADVDPDRIHPETGRSLKSIARDLSSTGGVRKRSDLCLQSHIQPDPQNA